MAIAFYFKKYSRKGLLTVVTKRFRGLPPDLLLLVLSSVPARFKVPGSLRLPCPEIFPITVPP